MWHSRSWVRTFTNACEWMILQVFGSTKKLCLKKSLKNDRQMRVIVGKNVVLSYLIKITHLEMCIAIVLSCWINEASLTQCCYHIYYIYFIWMWITLVLVCTYMHTHLHHHNSLYMDNISLCLRLLCCVYSNLLKSMMLTCNGFQQSVLSRIMDILVARCTGVRLIPKRLACLSYSVQVPTNRDCLCVLNLL